MSRSLGLHGYWLKGFGTQVFSLGFRALKGSEL